MNFKRVLTDKYFRILIFLLTLYSTFVIRAHNYEKVPTPNHLDELNYSLSGINLVETGIPMSWSTLDYPKRAEVFKGRIDYNGGIPFAYVDLYRPWLDQPPLFSLIVGWSAHLNGVNRNGFVPSSYSRIPVVLMATITSVMIFLIARLISGYWIGIFSMIVYGTVPLFVFASRSAMAENFIALILTIIFYLLLKFINNQKTWYIYPIPILVGIGGLSKATGFFILPFAIFVTFVIYSLHGKIKSAIISTLYLILGTLPFIAAFFAYGYLYDAEIFNRILEIQSHRPVGFGSLAWYFITPAYKTDLLKDSWFVFCLLTSVYLIFTTKFGLKNIKEFIDKKSLLVFAFICSIIIVMISGGENDLLAWYRFPSYPFLAIIGTWGLQYIVQKADFFATFLAAGLLLGNRMLLSNAFRDNIHPSEYRTILSLLLFPSILRPFLDNQLLNKICKALIIGVIIAGVYINIIYIYNAFEIACESKDCPIVPSTKLSTLHFPFFWRFMVLGKPDRY